MGLTYITIQSAGTQYFKCSLLSKRTRETRVGKHKKIQMLSVPVCETVSQEGKDGSEGHG